MSSETSFSAVGRLYEILRKVSSITMQQHLRQDSVKVVDRKPPPLPIYARQMALSFLSAVGMDLILKVHFALSFPQRFMKVPPGAVPSESSQIDFMKEFVNLFGGHVKNVMAQREVVMGFSLPIATRGYDNYFFESRRLDLTGPLDLNSSASSIQVSASWQLAIADITTVISADCHILDTEILDRIPESTEVHLAQSEEPEFF